MARKYSLLTIVLVIWLVETCLGYRHKSQQLSIRTSAYDKTLQPAFIRFPRTTCDDGIEDYEQVRLEEDADQPWDLYCLCDDPRWCLIYDLKGVIAGALISYIKDDLKNIPPEHYNFSSPNYIDKIIYNIPVKSVPIFFTNPEELTENGRNKTSELIEGVWSYLDCKWVRIDSKCQPNSPVIGDHFFRQGCAPRIGQIYVRLLYQETCKDDFFLYLVYEKDKLVGMGHGIPGIVSPGPRKNPYIYPGGEVLQTLMANPSKCFNQLSSTYGLTSIIIYINEDPWYIRCPKCLCN